MNACPPFIKLIAREAPWRKWHAFMHCFVIFLLIRSIPAWAEENFPLELLPKESFETLQRHAEKIHRASPKFAADLQWSNQDERVLLHLPKRGFRWLASLLDDELLGEAFSAFATPDYKWV